MKNDQNFAKTFLQLKQGIFAEKTGNVISLGKRSKFCEITMNKSSQSNINQKFANKYRISSARLANYDYSQNGAYFVTICTKNKKHYFGKIISAKMKLSDIGKIVADEWKKTPKIRNYIELTEWVIMPNHIHGILIITNDNNINRRDVLSKRLYKYDGQHPQMCKISPIKNSLSTAIRFFKRQTTIKSKKIDPNFAWQSRFHDRIVRNESEYQRITEYIHNNPMNWENDDYF